MNVVMVGTEERIVYAAPRRPRTFAEVGKAAPASSGRVIQFSVPFARATRRVIKDTEDVPF